MNKTVKLFLIFLIFSSSLFAISNKYYKDKFEVTKKLYLNSIMSNNKLKEINYLKKLIRYGDKLNINTTKYKRELNRIDKNTVLRSPLKTKSILKPKYTIKSVVQDKNSITINFYKNINKSYIKFSERKDRRSYYDEFDLKGSFKGAAPMKLSIFGVDKIKIFQYKKNTLRISLKNRKNLKTIYLVNKKQIIIKVLNLRKSKKSKIVKKVKLLPTNIIYPSKKIIVIDAGHGGRDSGAVGKSRRYEKVIVLNISKYLKQNLEKKGFKVYLTRSRDKYVRLSNRTKYANRKKADMFISIHANAARKSRARKAHGIETYFLSPARSERAKRVAALENKGDMKKMGWSSKNSLLTILNQSKITASNKMAIDIQKNMLYSLRSKYGKRAIRDGGVREGPFWVLVGAQMPSILVEVGYISHPQEGRRISTKSYQRLISKGIAEGIESYFIKN
ncbi:MAG: N-acetylmuramoyl-L-alanine amidase [Campylobacterota bacterium]|nr:N-acetylmuramoyl-L-alanine amidase [Campylobacterota bacterium]